MLRISITRLADGEALLSLEGLVRGRFAEELRRTCEPILAQGHHLTLDLSQVTFIDAQGVAVLRDLEKGNVAFSNPSTFVSEVLKVVGP
jgi:anti-anti-sigma regulatory factor